MLTDVVRQCHGKIANRFTLVVVAAERCRHLLAGARPTVENPGRERLMKVAMRELLSGSIIQDGDDWKVDRPPMPELILDPAPNVAEILGLTSDEEE